jgi:putative hemolysin
MIIIIVISTIFLILSIIAIKEAQASPNAAAMYCNRMDELYGNYTYEIQHTDDGDQAVCVMPNGTELEAWGFFAGRLGQSYSYCAKEGLQIYHVSNGTYSSEQAVCTVLCREGGGGIQGGVIFGLGFLGNIIRDWITGFAGITCGNVSVGELANINISERILIEPETSIVELSEPTLIGPYLNPSSYNEWNWKNPPSNTIWAKNKYQSFDFDKKDGWITPIRDQATCRSCWAFGTIGSVEAKYELEKNESNLNPDLSEQDVISFCGDSGYESSCLNGARTDAFGYLKKTGASDEACFPYLDRENCTGRCQNVGSRLWNISESFLIESETGETQITNIKNYTINYGPVTIIMDYGGYFDENCIYRCTYPNQYGKHIITIIGYKDTGNDLTSYWVAKNSFGLGWPGPDCQQEGEGYFRLGFGQCNLGLIILSEHVNEPKYGPKVVLNNPANNSILPAQTIKLNFTATTKIADKATCELLVNDSIKYLKQANNNTLTNFDLTLNPGYYSWKVRCWEEGLGIMNYSEKRFFTANQQDSIPPTYSQEYINSTVAGKATSFEIVWNDNLQNGLYPLGQYIFSFDNCAGVFTNDSPVSFGITQPAELIIEKTLSPSVNCDVKWRVYAKDNSNNWNVTLLNSPIFSFKTTTPADIYPPTHSLGYSDNTVIGNVTHFMITWMDNALKPNGQYIFSFDNCAGVFTNDSSVNFVSQSQEFLNISKTIATTIGCKVQWRVYARDNASNLNWNATPVYSFFTSEKQEALSMMSFLQKSSYNSSLIDLQYNKKVNASIKYGKSKRYLYSAVNSSFSNKLSLFLRNLEANTTYYYDLLVCDEKSICEEKISSFASLAYGTETNDSNISGNQTSGNESFGECILNQKKCSEDETSLLTCKNGNWEIKQCEKGCKNNKCYSESAGFSLEFGKINLSEFLLPSILVIIVAISIITIIIILARRKNQYKPDDSRLISNELKKLDKEMESLNR